MEQLLTLCASIIEGVYTSNLCVITNSISVESNEQNKTVMIDTNDAVLTVTVRTVTPVRVPSYNETTVKLAQYTDRPPVEVIEELTSIALKEWSECNSEYLIDNKIKQLLKK